MFDLMRGVNVTRSDGIWLLEVAPWSKNFASRRTPGKFAPWTTQSNDVHEMIAQ